MTANHASLSHHPAPHRDKVSVLESSFGLLGGPLAWFVQLCAGYIMASWPCYPMEEHRILPQNGYAWTWEAIVVVSIVAVIVCLAAFGVSRRTFNRTRDEDKGEHQHLLEVGSGRTRFLALWGMVLGAGFAVATAMTAIAFFVLPRCAG
jgi:Na+/melibiose symporter-like transporter